MMTALPADPVKPNIFSALKVFSYIFRCMKIICGNKISIYFLLCHYFPKCGDSFFNCHKTDSFQ